MSVRPQTKDKPSPLNFQWDDPFLLDEQLTEDERMIRDTARAYAQDKLLPRVAKAYLEEKVDRDIFHEMGELGVIGITLPEEYGCANASYVAYGLVAREIERVDTRASVSSSSGRWRQRSWCRRSLLTCRPISRSACRPRCGLDD